MEDCANWDLTTEVHEGVVGGVGTDSVKGNQEKEKIGSKPDKNRKPKPTESEGFEQIIDFLNGSSVRYALTASPTIHTSCIKQFWSTAKVKTVNDEVKVQVLIDAKMVTIKESSIRHTLKLDDEEGISCLANDEIFTGLANMGYEKIFDKLAFYKAFFSPQWKFLIHTILQFLSAKTTTWNEFSSIMASAIICLAINQKFNFSRYILLSLIKNIEAGVPFYMFPRFMQLIVDHQLRDMSHHQDIYDNPSLTKKVFANMKRVGTSFSGVITPLFENMLAPAAEEVSQAQDDVSIPTKSSTSKPHKKHKSMKQQPIAPKIEKLEERFHKLEEENRILKEKSFKSANIDTAEPVKDKEESFKQGMMIADMDEDVEVNLEETRAKAYNLDLQHSEKVLSMQDIYEEEHAEVEEVLEVVRVAKLFTEVVTTAEPTTTAAQVPKANAPRRRRGVVIQDLEETASSKVEEEVTVQEKEIEEEGNKRQGESLEQEIAKKQRMNEEAEELKRHMQIVANDDDDDVEDLETLWKLVKERFETTEPKNFSNDFLLNILKNMFEKPVIKANVWKDQKGRYGLAKVKSWKLFESCRVHIITLTTTQMFLLVEKKYPLTHFTLEKMLNNVRLKVKEESEMSLELLRLVRRQLNKEYVPE
uniref:Synaptobrevin, longin-like domain protein n=1 Tax=Tanacetum cinerariifolium TaxID=118510 RepID=A0A6L2IZQ0_TANCI|nr:hypothetical protein [Tanacetum cinerariifolium]